MRIGYLTKEYAVAGYQGGGLSSYLRRITLALAQQGHEIHVFFYSDHLDGVQHEEGITIHRINNRGGPVQQALNRMTFNRVGNTLAALEGSRRLRRCLQAVNRATPLDIVQSTNYGLLCLLAADLQPTVIRCSSYRPLWDRFDRVRSSLDRRVYTRLEALQYRRVAGAFAPTRLLATVLQQELGLAEVEVLRTPFFLEVDELDDSICRETTGGREFLLFFGRLSPQKGPQTLAAALPRVWREHPDLLAVFIGGYDKYDRSMRMTEYIRQQCAGFEDNLRLIPPLLHPQLYPFIQRARLVVLPSLMDNAPNTLLEAMGFGRPVIGTTGASLDEFIEDGVSGFLTPPGDAAALADVINRVWSSAELTAIGAAALQAAEQLHPERLLPELVAFYQKHAQNKPPTVHGGGRHPTQPGRRT